MKNEKLIDILMQFPLDMEISCAPSFIGDKLTLVSNKKEIYTLVRDKNYLKDIGFNLCAEFYLLSKEPDVPDKVKEKMMAIIAKYKWRLG